MGKLPYDPIAGFEPVITIGTIPHLLVVGAAQPFQSVADLLARKGAWWHVHCHVMAACGFWPIELLRASWARAARRATADAGPRDAWGVHLGFGQRSVRSLVEELAKYVSKPLASRDMPLSELADLIAATHRKRMMWTTGCFRGVDLVDYSAPAEVVEGADDDRIGQTASGRVVNSWAEITWVRGDDATAEYVKRKRQAEARKEHRLRPAVDVEALQAADSPGRVIEVTAPLLLL
jgi:hypothetical protein